MMKYKTRGRDAIESGVVKQEGVPVHIGISGLSSGPYPEGVRGFN